MTDHAAQFLLSRDELVGLLHLVGSSHLVGIRLDEPDLPSDKYEELLARAFQSLTRRSLISASPPTTHAAIAESLFECVNVLAYREFAAILVRGRPSRGQQIYIYNCWHGQLVLHTFPTPESHWIARIASRNELARQLQTLMPLAPSTAGSSLYLDLTENDLEKLREDAQSGQPGTAINRLISAGFSSDTAKTLVQALSAPLLTLSVAFLQCSADTIDGATSIAVFGDTESAWGIWPLVGQQPTLRLRPVGYNDLSDCWTRWLEIAGCD